MINGMSKTAREMSCLQYIKKKREQAHLRIDIVVLLIGPWSIETECFKIIFRNAISVVSEGQHAC